MRLGVALCALLLSLQWSSSARAALLAPSSSSLDVLEARVAFAQGPTRSTAWYQFRLASGPTELLWVLPVPPGAGVDLASSSFFDALEHSSAVRLRPLSWAPSGSASTCEKPGVHNLVRPEIGEAGTLLWQGLYEDISSLEKDAGAAGYDLSKLEVGPLLSAAKGGSLLALRLAPSSTPDGKAATFTVRISGPDVPLVLPRVLAGDPAEADLSLWLLGNGRGHVAGMTDLVVDSSQVHWLSPTLTDYRTFREQLIRTEPNSMLLEAANHEMLSSPTTILNFGTIQDLLGSYYYRVFEREEASSQVQPALGAARSALKNTIAEPCSRGDLVSPVGCAQGAGAAPETLSPSPGADDLGFCLAGGWSSRWLTRLVGRISPLPESASKVEFFASSPSSMVYGISEDNAEDCLPTGTPSPSGTPSTPGGSSPPADGGSSYGSYEQTDDYGSPDLGCSSSTVGSGSSDDRDDRDNGSDRGDSDYRDDSDEGYEDDGEDDSGDDWENDDWDDEDEDEDEDSWDNEDSDDSEDGEGGSSSGCSTGRRKPAPRSPTRWFLGLAALMLPWRRAWRKRSR